MAVNPVTCPRCQSTNVVKNGKIHNGPQNFKCKACKRQFVQNPTKKVIGQETRDLIDKLLLKRLSLAGIATATGVSDIKSGKLLTMKATLTPPGVPLTHALGRGQGVREDITVISTDLI